MQTPADQTYDRVWADVRALLAGRNAPQVREIHRYPAALAVVLDGAPVPPATWGQTLCVTVTHASPFDDLYAMLLAKLHDELEARWPRTPLLPEPGQPQPREVSALEPIATWGERLAEPVAPAPPKPGDHVAWNDVPSGALVRDNVGEIALRIGERGDWVYLRVPFACGAQWVWYSWRDEVAWSWPADDVDAVTIVALDVPQGATPAEMRALVEKT